MTGDTAPLSASGTAWGVMVLRAAHQLFDEPPRILDDPVAPLLLDDDTRTMLGDPARRDRARAVRALQAHVLVRSRYAEDQLESAVAHGIRQFVSLGAGYDTFAYRQPPWAQVLQIFEVDQAATQLAKRERLTAAGVPVPDNVTYVAADFRRETLAQALVRSGFDMSMQTFISCLGVLVYLEAAAVDAIFHFAAALASGSEIVVTFRRQRDADDSSELSAAVAARGEPWISAFDPEALRAALLTMGFASVTLVFGSELDVRYTLRRTDGLHPPQRMMMLSARR